MAIAIPWPVVDGVLAILPLAWAFRRRHRRNRDADGCRRCGYSLTGNTSGVCPEMFSLL
jgi:hypothetical protein